MQPYNDRGRAHNNLRIELKSAHNWYKSIDDDLITYNICPRIYPMDVYLQSSMFAGDVWRVYVRTQWPNAWCFVAATKEEAALIADKITFAYTVARIIHGSHIDRWFKSSASSPDCSAFHGDTRSAKTVNDWLQRSSVSERHQIVFTNVVNTPTSRNRPVTVDELNSALNNLKLTIDNLQPHRIIALGNTAAVALHKINEVHLKMPHPSGRNLKLNNKDYVCECIERLAEWCE